MVQWLAAEPDRDLINKSIARRSRVRPDTAQCYNDRGDELCLYLSLSFFFFCRCLPQRILYVPATEYVLAAES